MASKKRLPNRFSWDATIRGGPVDIDIEIVLQKLQDYCLRLKDARDLDRGVDESEKIGELLIFAASIYSHLNKYGDLAKTEDFFNSEIGSQDHSFISGEISGDVSKLWVDSLTARDAFSTRPLQMRYIY